MLDKQHGNVLRAMSAAVAEVVGEIFEGSFDLDKKAPIECVEAIEILRHPRGSPQLLGLLSDSETSGPHTA